MPLSRHNLLARGLLLIQLGTPLGAVVVGQGYEGLIVAAPVSTQSGSWSPTERDIREAEGQLAAYLASAEAAPLVARTRIRSQLAKYKRQYWGIKRGNGRVLLISFIHDSALVDEPGRWRTTSFLLEDGTYPTSTGVAVAGGGDRYFRVLYDLDSKRFSGLKINAPI